MTYIEDLQHRLNKLSLSDGDVRISPDEIREWLRIIDLAIDEVPSENLMGEYNDLQSELSDAEDRVMELEKELDKLRAEKTA